MQCEDIRSNKMAVALPLVAYPDLESQVRAMESDGYAFLPAVIDAVAVAELRAGMDELTSIAESFDRDRTPEDGGFLNKSINNVFNRHPLFLQYLDQPGVIELAEAVHGSDCHVIGMTAWLTGPGRPDQRLHTDWLPLALPEDLLADPRVKVPIFITTAHFYLDDITDALGPRSSSREAIAPAEVPMVSRTGTASRNRASCAARATSSSSAARCGTGAPRTGASRRVTSSRSTTPSG